MAAGATPPIDNRTQFGVPAHIEPICNAVEIIIDRTAAAIDFGAGGRIWAVIGTIWDTVTIMIRLRRTTPGIDRRMRQRVYALIHRIVDAVCVAVDYRRTRLRLPHIQRGRQQRDQNRAKTRLAAMPRINACPI